MALPIYSNIEIPILHELSIVGGSDFVRFLYERLIPYFPQLDEIEIPLIKNGNQPNWCKAVQKAGKSLDEKNLIRRKRGFWVITEKGRQIISDEISGFIITKPQNETLSHTDIQQMICRIGKILGFFAETEFEYYDVIWRETPNSQRISHIFEVQSKGNIDSAFAKLKRAFDAQRSKPFLILASERDTRRAAQSLKHEFRELENKVTILSFAQMQKIHDNLSEIAELLPTFFDT
ncbi:hypothetical protein BH10ACI1_BH10ACI1_32590 [soil metagenome]